MAAPLIGWTMPSSPGPRLSSPCALDSAAALDSVSSTILGAYHSVQGVHPKTQKTFWRGGSVRCRTQCLASETFYSTLDTLDTLDRGKKTKGYGLVPVQGVQGVTVCPPHTLADRPRPRHPCVGRMGMADAPARRTGGVTGPCPLPRVTGICTPCCVRRYRWPKVVASCHYLTQVIEDAKVCWQMKWQPRRQVADMAARWV